MTAAARAPGRVELLGNHTDYNEGVVLGAAIDRRATVTGASRADETIAIRSADFGAVKVQLSQLRPLTENRWANYALGVVHELRELGVPVAGFDAQVSSDVPIGSGLSSSAAFELASALFILKLFPHQLAPMEIAKACQRAENHFAGVQSGLLDQITSLFGRKDCAVFFDARTEEVRIVPFPAGLALVIAESGKKRELASGEYNLRREQTRAAAAALGVHALRDLNSAMLASRSDIPALLRSRAAHIVGENDRVWHAVELLNRGDGEGFGQLMNQSHESSRQNFENSTPELDLLVSIARQLPGVLGARLTGGGFGGATVTLCQRAGAVEIANKLSRKYEAQTGIAPRVFVCEIADGAA
ncbi:MAG: galactokinase [Verrucomicrobia bacterium]|nr:galactokinase [Verrucomicrobiota bacterium]